MIERPVTEVQRPRPLQQSIAPELSEDDQGVFFQTALNHALAAQAKRGVVERSYALADAVVSLRFAGESLVSLLTGALAHLQVPSNSHPDAVFHIWDGEPTDDALLPPPCSPGCFTSRGDIWTMASPRFKSAYIWGERAFNLFDTATATGLYWTQGADSMPYWTKASPLRCLFHWWAETIGCQLVHGAAVGSQGRAALISGNGGTGKSTTALSCLRKGLSYIGDDYVVVKLGASPRVYSLYCTAKLDWDQMARFPEFADLTDSPHGREGDKAVIYLYPQMQGQLARSLPLKTILTPRFSSRPQTELEPVSPVDLHRAVAFTTMCQLPHASHHTHQYLGRLVEGLPGLRLALGSDLDVATDVIAGLLTTSGSRQLDCVSSRADNEEALSGRLVSIVIPVHNAARFVPGTIADILAQKYPAIEVIVVDAGSTDEIKDVVGRLPLDVRFVKHHNTGLTAARNRGIREASGEFVTFLDVGTWWPAGFLQTMVELLSDESGCDVVQGLGQLTTADVKTSDHNANLGEFFLDHHAAALYRRESFRSLGLFDEELEGGGNSDWHCRAKEHGLKLRRVHQIMLTIGRDAVNAMRKPSLRELNTLKALKTGLDQKRAERRVQSEAASAADRQSDMER